MQLRAEPPAKINLALAITGRRPDGYHTLRSVFLRLALHDELEVDVDGEAAVDQLVVDGEADGEALDAGPDNLILRAVTSLRGLIGGPLPALRFRLVKHIPVAAGLGGGSADGSAALDLAQAAWGVRLHPSARLDAALRLGADVPFFSAGHSAALVAGIGEQLRPLPTPHPPPGILLVTPPGGLPTAAVFAEFDAGPLPDPSAMQRVDELVSLLQDSVDGLTLAATTAMLRDANDLWSATTRLSGSLSETRAALSDLLGHNMLLSGSGPTLFAVYPSQAAAARAADQLREASLPELDGGTIIATSTA